MSAATIQDICGLLASRNDAKEAVTSGKTFVPLLALLEHSLASVDSTLHACLLNAGFSEVEATPITAQRVALFALTGENGSHWRERAVSWFEDGLHMNEHCIKAIRAIEQDMRVSQSLRHRARAIRRRYEVRDA